MMPKFEITIALDAMGGDHGAEPNVEGALIAANANPVRILLVGNEFELKKSLEGESYPDGSIEIIHASDHIGMDEPPREALELPHLLFGQLLLLHLVLRLLLQQQTEHSSSSSCLRRRRRSKNNRAKLLT